MDPTPRYNVVERPDAGAVIVVDGDWTSDTMNAVVDRLDTDFARLDAARLDVSRLGRLDTAGAYALLRAANGRLSSRDFAHRPATAKLVALVERATDVEHRRDPKTHPFFELLVRIGRGLSDGLKEMFYTLAFTGRLTATLIVSLLNPSRLRWAAIFSNMDRAGLDAMPVVAVTSFFVGAVVAFLGAQTLAAFGAQVFVVELIGIAVLREFAVLITAVLLAGRSSSSFAAEIGSMKMNQEVDAMRVLGVDPFEALVLPRFIAMLIMTPLLTFAAVIAGLAGGLIVTWASLDLSPLFFLQRIIQNVGHTQFLVGLSKAPVLAAVIAGIGCRQGLQVGGDVESLGQRVTAAVVHAIFAIILLDAVFALVYMELGI